MTLNSLVTGPNGTWLSGRSGTHMRGRGMPREGEVPVCEGNANVLAAEGEALPLRKWPPNHAPPY